MGQKNVSLDGARRAFDSATGYANHVKNDVSDPASPSLMRALHDYFRSNGEALAAIADGVNHLIDRIERMERAAQMGRK